MNSTVTNGPSKAKGVSLFWLKWLAFALMVLDHIGAYIVPEVWGLRLIGRGAFILYAWFFVQGAKFSRRPLLYFWRLTCCAFVSQFILVLFFPSFRQLNVIFLFMFCLGFIFIDRFKLWERRLYCLGVGSLAQVLGVEYGLYGAMVIFGLYYRDFMFWLLGGILSFQFSFQPIVFGFWWIEPLMKVRRGKSWIGFYYLYPLQWLIIGLWRVLAHG